MKDPVLGILGGLGPASGAYFYDMLIKHTRAQRDSDHIDVLLTGCASTPDRTEFIMGKSDKSPLPDMLSCAKSLVSIGADYIAIPCNTAHYFYSGLSEAVNVPVINIIEETVSYLAHMGVRRVGVLATDGTVHSGSYLRACERAGITCLAPDEKGQEIIMDTIYGCIKAGKRPDMASFKGVCDSLVRAGCQRLILGCTELSLLKGTEGLSDSLYVDSLEVLACRCITLCGGESIDFPDSMIEWSKR